MQKPLTKRQEEVLDWIKAFIASNGYSPTRQEIADGMGFASVNASEVHIKALERKHAITVKRGVARSIVVKDVARTEVSWGKAHA